MIEKVPIAFLAGLLSVITPCVLPLVPGYLSAVSAVEADRLGKPGSATRVVIGSRPFIAGLPLVFVVLVAGAAAIELLLPSDGQTELAEVLLVAVVLAFV